MIKKSTAWRLLATHLLGLTAGGLLYVATASESVENTSRPAARATHRTSVLTPENTHRALTRRIQAHVEQAIEWDEILNSDQSIRALGLEAIRLQPQLDRENQAKLRSLLTLADTYKSTADLNPAIRTALVSDDYDPAAAIFIEWHRRDPAAAYDAMASREYLIDGETACPIFVHLSNEGLLSEALRKDRYESFRYNILYNLAQKYGQSDDLASLSAAMSQADAKSTEQLVSVFVEYWVPDDGAAAAEYLCNKIPSSQRLAILEELSEGILPGDNLLSQNTSAIFPMNPYRNPPSNAWTDDFSAALFSYDLAISDELRTKLRKVANSTDLTWADIPNIYGSSNLPKLLTPNLSSEEAYNRIRRQAHEALFNSKDYPELFANGTLSAEQIFESISREIENSNLYPESLARVIFPYLAAQNPHKTAVWARSYIPAEILSAEVVSFLKSIIDYDEPRLARVFKMLDTFQPELAKSEKLDGLWHRFFHEFKKLRESSPREADLFLLEMDPKHPIWQEIKKRKGAP